MQDSLYWKCEKIYTDGDEFFNSLLCAIRAARESIELEAYIFEADQLGNRIVFELKNAAARGVCVRVIVDGWGSPGWRRFFGEELRQAKVQFKIYHELPWERLLYRRAAGKCRLTLHALLWRMNKRNHRKVCIIDGHSAWLGSMNITARHLHSLKGKEAWRDTAICVVGEEVKRLVHSFNSCWSTRERYETWLEERKLRRLGPTVTKLVRLNSTRRLRRENYRELILRIATAKQEVLITTAYFVPKGSLLRVLFSAARRGVDVRVLVSRKSDVFFMPWAASAFYYSLLQHQVRIFEYLPRILHAKTLLIDDWAVVGSSNLNHRSLVHDLEVDAVVSSREEHAKLRQQFFADLTEAEEVTWERWNLQSALKRLLGHVALFFRYFM